MARYLSDIRASVRDILRDEFEEGVTLEWETDELDRLIRIILDKMELSMPYEVKAIAGDELTQVKTEISAAGTNLEVDSDDDFPTTYPFFITIEDEVLSVTALASADNFTVTRAQKGSTAAIHVVNKGVGLTIVTAENSKEIDISGIADIIRVYKCEYRIQRPSYNPKQYRNFDVFADILTIDINILPSDKEEVHLLLHKKHILTENRSTLRPPHETVLIQGVVARAAMNKGREQINALNVGGVNVGPRMVTWGNEQWGLFQQALTRNAIKNPYEMLPVN